MSGDRLAPTRMVHLRTVRTPFHARVIAARLGADGILTELRGNVGGPYPLGESSVWVTEADADEASELLLADEVEAAYDTDGHGDGDGDDTDSDLAGGGVDRLGAGGAGRRYGLTPVRVVAAAGLVLLFAATLAARFNV